MFIPNHTCGPKVLLAAYEAYLIGRSPLRHHVCTLYKAYHMEKPIKRHHLLNCTYTLHPSLEYPCVRAHVQLRKNISQRHPFQADICQGFYKFTGMQQLLEIKRALLFNEERLMIHFYYCLCVLICPYFINIFSKQQYCFSHFLLIGHGGSDLY